MDTLTIVILVCQALTLDTCDYRNADRVYRLPNPLPAYKMLHMGGADKDGNHVEWDAKLPLTYACHDRASTLMRNYSKDIKRDQMLRWLCVPTAELDAAGIKEGENPQ